MWQTFTNKDKNKHHVFYFVNQYIATMNSNFNYVFDLVVSTCLSDAISRSTYLSQEPHTFYEGPLKWITAGLWLSSVQDPVVASQVVDGENIKAACPPIVQSFKHVNNNFSNILKPEASKGMLYKLPHSLYGYRYIHILYIYISCRLNGRDTYR